MTVWSETGIGLPSDVGQPVQAPCSEIASAPRLEEDQAVGQRRRVRDGVWVRGTVNLGSAARRTASYSPPRAAYSGSPRNKRPSAYRPAGLAGRLVKDLFNISESLCSPPWHASCPCHLQSPPPPEKTATAILDCFPLQIEIGGGITWALPIGGLGVGGSRDLGRALGKSRRGRLPSSRASLRGCGGMFRGNLRIAGGAGAPGKGSGMCEGALFAHHGAPFRSRFPA